MSKTLRALIVEDSEDDATLLLKTLRYGGFQPVSHRVMDAGAMADALREHDWDIVFCDYVMPAFDAPAALRLLQSTGREIPFIVISGTVGEEVAVETLKLGASDYLLKQNLTRLIPAVEGELRAAEERRRSRATERAMRLILANSLDVICTLDENSQFITVSNAARSVWGYDPAELIGRVSCEFVHPDDVERTLEMRAHVKNGRPVRDFQNRWRRKDGELVDIMWSANWSPADQTFFAIARDVTEHRKVENALRESAANMEAAQRIARFGSWELDLTGAELERNPLRWADECFRVFGYEPGSVEVTNELFFSRIPPEDHGPIRAAVAKAIRERSDYAIVHQLMLPGGERRFIHEQARVFADAHTGQPQKMVGIAHDITEHILADERVRENAELLNKAHDAIIQLDQEHRIRFWNQSAERIYGWTNAEVQGRKYVELLQRNLTGIVPALAETAHVGGWTGELNQVHKSGQEVVVDATLTLVRSSTGRPDSILVIATNITERKKLEFQFLRAQRMESIGTLAGGIAHDLNNVLAPIVMSVIMLREGLPETEKLALLDTLETSARRGAELVRQVLTFARGAEGQRIAVDLRSLIKEMKKISLDTFPKNIRLESHLAPDAWNVSGDPTQLHQLLLNLCVNARDAMPHGGKIVINLENTTLDQNHVAMNPEAKPGAYAVLRVTDTGTGIPPELREKIFEPFFTTKEIGKGTGLGLSTVMAIVRGHGGFLKLYSEPGQGSTFTTYLPATTTAARAVSAEFEKNHLARGRGETILVVDDEPAVLEVTEKTLIKFGYRVLTARDGAEALAIYVQHQDAIKLVLTDMMMPIMDGPATALALNRVNPRLQIIGASGLMSEFGMAKAASAGIQHFLPKPYTAEIMLKLVAEVLKGGPAHSAARLSP